MALYGSKQEVFDVVTKHLLTQNQKSRVDTSCMYRGPGSLKCAVGALIPDDVYSYAMEGYPACVLLEQFSGVAATLFGDSPKQYEGLLVELQLIHDNSYVGVEKWPEELYGVAKAFGFQEPDELREALRRT